jgi:GntR family transcriptional regulator/MocR family aminotransferase
MQPLSTLLSINKQDRQATYLQIAQQLMDMIRRGVLQAGYRLLSSRELATALKVNRVTVVKAYDELLVQGWLQSQVGKGTFVAANLPEMQPEKFTTKDSTYINPVKNAGFSFTTAPHLARPVMKATSGLHFDDGFPDARLAPLSELSRAYRTQLLMGNPYSRLGYNDTKGSLWLREQLSVYLNGSRGLKTTAENILIVRGTMMGFYLAVTGLVERGDNVIISEMDWGGTYMALSQAGANMLKVPVDQHGIDVDVIERLCQKQKIRMVFVTSHHQYPTTVALRADRRLKLLSLAQEHGFIIFEDDYDYEFHYANKPLLPLAGADHQGMVLYCGSFTKIISPAFRVGYLTGPEDVIDQLARLRRIIDRQGDLMLENALAELLEYGLIQRHLRKSMREYKQRRDVFCEALKGGFGDRVNFAIPDGGMAVWTQFDPQINMVEFAQKALQKGLYFSDGTVYGPHNFTRLGFASSNTSEMEQGIEIMKKSLT